MTKTARDILHNFALTYRVESKESRNQHLDQALKELEAIHQQEIAKATKDPFDYVEPCEPDCSAERHAYHQGQWDMAHRMADRGLTLKEHKED